MKSLTELDRIFDLLIPEKLEGGLLVILLHRKIEDGVIEEEFTRQDIIDGLDEVARLAGRSAPQTERILKRLIPFFFKRPPEKAGKYYLSEYAKNFVLLIEHKLESPFRDFPLKKNFEKYFAFDSTEIHGIEDLEAWYQQSFIGASRKVISQHLESLQDELEQAVQQLNGILHSDELTALEMARGFALIFQRMGAKQEQIMDALFYKDGIIGELKQAVAVFYHEIEAAKHHENAAEKVEFERLHQDWQRAEAIAQEVSAFFRSVDKRLERINSQIIYSSSKLTELQENFKSQSRFKINLKKLLELVLTESRFGKESLALPDQFPQKGLPNEETKFFGVPYHDFRVEAENQSFDEERDAEYENEQRAAIEYEMDRQQRITQLVENLRAELSDQGELVWSDRFFSILKQEQDPEVPLQVGFELVQGVQSKDGQSIEITQSLKAGSEKSEFTLWEMKIKAD